jgi:hypothetical protein
MHLLSEDAMSLDLFIAVTLTAFAAAAVAALCIALPATATHRIWFAVGLSAWFFTAVVLGVTGSVGPGGLGTVGVGIAVTLPLLAIGCIALRWPPLRAALVGIPVPILIGTNSVRVLGVLFVVLHVQGRLPSLFVTSAGWGDVAIGLTALPVAWLVIRRVGGWRPIALAWNTLGLADLVMAVFLGVASAADSPIRLFTGEFDAAAMSVLPMFLIPGFLVPLLVLTHLAVFYRLSRPAPTMLRTAST